MTTDRRLDRIVIDDGLHRPQIVIDEDASTSIGTALWRAECSCGRMPHHISGTPEGALAAHLDHVTTRIGPSKGPAWLPLGARITLLTTAMLVICIGCFAAGRVIIRAQDLTGPAAEGIAVGSVLTGFVLAFSLMVAARHYIAPTRA
ncbi:hypothetical protein ACSCBZ_46945 [Streptomyces niveiscabiei]|uniref:hypothetical protein n=1 Tax=Streptomyces niveiscabiei TaxID=164115 RepID=UPI0006EB54D4|nr:hypothetical protein [Streptomyces niveiscabiei]